MVTNTGILFLANFVHDAALGNIVDKKEVTHTQTGVLNCK